MKKGKIISAIAAACCLALCAMCFAACGDNVVGPSGPNGGGEVCTQHRFVNYVYNNDATCVKAGTETAKCENCEQTDTRISATHLATGVHDYSEYVCKNCNVLDPNAPVTEGLEYTEVKNGDTVIGYSVKKGSADNVKFVKIPSMYSGKPVVNIGDEAFRGCRSLTSIIIPNSVTSIGSNAFSDCSSLTSITVDINNPNYSSYDGILYDKAKTNIIHVPQAISGRVTIPSSVTSIGIGAFSSCESLTSITVDINNPNYSSYDGILYNKTQTNFVHVPLAISGRVTIPNSITSIGNSTFADCSNLTSIEIPNSVTSIGSYAFSDCSSLMTIEIPNGVTSIGKSAFYGCRRLTSVELSNSIISIENSAFENCRSLTSIEIPNGVTRIGEIVFKGCSNLSKIKISDSVMSIGWCAFIDTAYYDNEDNWDNGALYIDNHLIKAKETLTGSYTIKQGTILIADGAFEDCVDLSSVEIPDSVTTICCYAFLGCGNLTSIIIPNSVTNIGELAFSDCDNLTIYCEAAEQPSEWATNWNKDSRPVVWGYKG